MMKAGFGWIDFSNAHRDRVFSVVDMLSESTAIDELGIGVVRDAISDWLFPGVSTIQTRPKYFVLLPQLLLNYLKRYSLGSKMPPLKQYLKDEENKLMYVLASNANFEEGLGIIGVTKARTNGELARKASSIYWNGLRTHGIIDTHLSLSEYLQLNNLSGTRDMGLDGDANHIETSFGITIPTSFTIPEDINMELTPEEASYLRDQFISNRVGFKESNNLLKFILSSDIEAQEMMTHGDFKAYATTFMAKGIGSIDLRQVVQTALNFDFLMHGAHIRYNILLQEQSGTKDFSEKWDNWLEEYREKTDNEKLVDFDYLFQNIATRVKSPTQTFMRSFQDEVARQTLDLFKIDSLVTHQESLKKGKNKKLGNPNTEVNDWIGIEQLNYRFNQGKAIVKDILKANA